MIRAAARELRAQMAGLLVMLIRIYQWVLSPFLGGQCRFEPSCSHYGIACITIHGPVRGTWLSLCRVCRCHPFHAGGYDPPPPRSTDSPEAYHPAILTPSGPTAPGTASSRLCPVEPARESY